MESLFETEDTQTCSMLPRFCFKLQDTMGRVLKAQKRRDLTQNVKTTTLYI